MNISTEIIVTEVNHYDMGDNKGVSAKVVGSKQKTNNSFGVSVSPAVISDYNELQYLQRFADQLPAKFKADLQLTKKKASNGQEITAVAYSNLTFMHEIEFVEKKAPVKA